MKWPSSKVKLSKFGYYTLSKKPNYEKLKKYYQKKYYQVEDKYSSIYTQDEFSNIKNKLNLKYYIIKKYFPESKKRSLLELGAGEGWTLKFFKDKNWQVTGIDFSDFGAKTHNPEIIDNLMVGDIIKKTQFLIKEQKTYDIIWLDNVLEHVLDPEKLLEYCIQLLKPSGMLIIEVPNDFSPLQIYLLSNGFVDKPYWLVIPDHISYFSAESLNKLCKSKGFKEVDRIADFPIDFFLLNKHTNYVKYKGVGKECHFARVRAENFIAGQQIAKSLNFYREMAKLHLGRQIIGFYKKT